MLIKKIYFFVAMLFAAQLVMAQYKLSGKITDFDTQEPVKNASVYLVDLKKSTVSDQNGNYTFQNLKSGKYFVEITGDNYTSLLVSIEVSQDAVSDFTLQKSAKEIDEVVVTAVTRASELKKIPVVIKSVDKNIINQNASTNLIDGLKNIPGVNQITSGAAISKPVIRGLGYNRVITLVDGIKQEGQQWGGEHGIEIDEFSVGKVEIVKGPGSLMYGSDGIAGVLNFISPKVAANGKIENQLITNYQTNNNLIATSFSNKGNKNGFVWEGRLTNKLAGNYENKYDGKVLNSGFKELDGNLMLGINKNWGHSYFNVSSYNTTLNIVEGERDADGKFTFINNNGDDVTATDEDYKGYKVGFPHQKINHLRLTSNNYFLLKNGTINADFAFQNNKRKEFADATKPDEKELFFDLNTFNYNVRYNVKETNNWETSFGIGGMQQSNTNKGVEALIPDYQFFDAGAFVFTQKTFNKNLTLAGGLRFDNRNVDAQEMLENTDVKFAKFNKNYSGISGSLGLSYQLDKQSTIKLNLSRGFRVPNIAELSSNGIHEGTFRYEIGDINLKSEISHQIDAAYFLNSDHISFEFTPFVNFISNYIYTEKMQDANGNDVIIDPSDPVPAFRFTQGNAQLFGGEIFLDFHPHPFDWLHVENSFSYVRATQNNRPENEKFLPFIPAPKYRGEIKTNFEKVNNTFSDFYAKFSVDHYFKQNNIYSAFDTETATPSYTLLSVGIGADIKAFGKKDFFNVFISGENLTDVAYQNHLSRLKYAPENPATGRMGVFNMGRNFSVKLMMNF
ncbi:TonB-dependent receptor [Cloacibacterium caeni]|uniref:TonB-dependent receptor n=1 Tax=Cloacibacterium caeni TaxID=2004710 RepID=UPI001BD0C0C8|nr:TonB-dependent receptor [Cloacibacterium caeni]